MIRSANRIFTAAQQQQRCYVQSSQRSLSLLLRRRPDARFVAASRIVDNGNYWAAQQCKLTVARFSSHPPAEKTKLQMVVLDSKKGGAASKKVCYGCGADIVKADKMDPVSKDSTLSPQTKTSTNNYWDNKKERLRKSKVSNWALCPRCRALQRASEHDEVNVPAQSVKKGLAMQAFRDQVKQVRSEHAVVVAVVDAVNSTGTVMKGLRNYVGGNPIVLAVTRCDLLLRDERDKEAVAEHQRRLRRILTQRTRHLQVAEIFFMSIPPSHKSNKGNKRKDDLSWDEDGADESVTQNPGVAQLAAAILKKRKDRDVYVVGAANIGKSTLTTALVDELIAQQSELAFVDEGGRLGEKRIEAIKSKRITASALPGTTLQNIRVPCFVNHQQALWDTPGLLLDVTEHHFPIRNMEILQRSTPKPIVPRQVSSNSPGFIVQLGEPGDDPRLPLLRLVVRLRRREEESGRTDESSASTTRITWNSIFPLETTVLSKPPPPPPVPAMPQRPDEDIPLEEDDSTDDSMESNGSKKKSKEERKKAYDARIKKAKEIMGPKEWKRLNDKYEAEMKEYNRTKKLEKLSEISTFTIEAGVSTDIAIENLGWFAFLCERDAKIQVYAANTGVKVSVDSPSLYVPKTWDCEEEVENIDINGDKDTDDSGGDSHGDDSDDDHDDHDDYDDSYDSDYDEYEEFHDGYGTPGRFWDEEYYAEDGTDEFNFIDDEVSYRGGRKDFKSDEPIRDLNDDLWAEYSGRNVGWEFLADTRFMKNTEEDGWNPVVEKERKIIWKPPINEYYRIRYPDKARKGKEKERKKGFGRQGRSGKGYGSTRSSSVGKSKKKRRLH